jgi:hypothetical protein
VVVWDVEPARVDEANSRPDVGADEGGEVLQSSESNGATSTSFDGVVLELEGDVTGIGRVGQKHALAVGETGAKEERGLELFDLCGISGRDTAACRGCRIVIWRWSDWSAEDSSDERSCECGSEEFDHDEASGLMKSKKIGESYGGMMVKLLNVMPDEDVV